MYERVWLAALAFSLGGVTTAWLTAPHFSAPIEAPAAEGHALSPCPVHETVTTCDNP